MSPTGLIVEDAPLTWFLLCLEQLKKFRSRNS